MLNKGPKYFQHSDFLWRFTSLTTRLSLHSVSFIFIFFDFNKLLCGLRCRILEKKNLISADRLAAKFWRLAQLPRSCSASQNAGAFWLGLVPCNHKRLNFLIFLFSHFLIFHFFLKPPTVTRIGYKSIFK